MAHCDFRYLIVYEEQRCCTRSCVMIEVVVQNKFARSVSEVKLESATATLSEHHDSCGLYA